MCLTSFTNPPVITRCLLTPLFARQPKCPASPWQGEQRGCRMGIFMVWCWMSPTCQWPLPSPSKQLLLKRSLQGSPVNSLLQGLWRRKACLQSMLLTKGGACWVWAVSSRRGVKTAFWVQEQGKREYYMCRGFLWDQNCLQYNVPAPVGWCGFACCSALPEKLLIYYCWWNCCFDLSLCGIPSSAFNKSPTKEVQVGALCFSST